jgi:putative CocE/NonD family hydrolase
MMQGFTSLPSSYRDNDGRWADIWINRLDKLADSEPWLFQHTDNQIKNEYWTEMDPDVSKIETPILAVSGWRDYYPQALLDHLPQADVPKRIILGPWRHRNPELGRETAIDFRGRMVEWFDYFLKGVDNDALNHPKISYWTERAGGGKVGEGIWRKLDEWPGVDNDATVKLSLTPSGLIESDDYDEGDLERSYDVDHSVGMSAIRTLETPIDTNFDDSRSMCFETTSLEHPIEITGTGMATIRFSSTMNDPLLVARLIDISPDGSASLVTIGCLKASHRNGHANVDPLSPNEVYKLTIPLQPVSHIFEVGHQIRLALSGAWFPRVLPSSEHGSITVLSTPDNPSTVNFPGAKHHHSPDFDNLIEMDPPQSDFSEPRSKFVDRSQTIETTREQLSDTGRMEITTEESIDLPHGPRMERFEDLTWEVAADDPKTFSLDSVMTITLHYADHENIETDLST